MADVDARLVGPLFDGRAERAVKAAATEATESTAEHGAQLVRAIVGRRAKNPSGRFAARVTVDRRSADGFRVHTPGLRYGGWLEGTSHRNQISSFKGWHLYREATQELTSRAEEITARALGNHMREING